jgi:DNA-binding transcriptional LysR family regulator
MDRLHGMLVFLRVVEHGSLSAAAHALGVSTSRSVRRSRAWSGSSR